MKIILIFAALFQVALIVLKVVGFLTWSWLVVLLPVIVWASLVTIGLVSIAIQFLGIKLFHP